MSSFKKVGYIGISSEGEFFWTPNWAKEARKACWNVAGFADFNFQEAWLQSFYTPELRRDICIRLSRIEYGICPRENAREILALLRKYQVDENYFGRLFCSVVIDKDKARSVMEKAGMVFEQPRQERRT